MRVTHHGEVLRSLHVVVNGSVLHGGLDLHPGDQVPDLYLAGGVVEQRSLNIMLGIVYDNNNVML